MDVLLSTEFSSPFPGSRLLDLFSWYRLYTHLPTAESLTPEVLALVPQPSSLPTDDLSKLQRYYICRNSRHRPWLTVMDLLASDCCSRHTLWLTTDYVLLVPASLVIQAVCGGGFRD